MQNQKGPLTALSEERNVAPSSDTRWTIAPKTLLDAATIVTTQAARVGAHVGTHAISTAKIIITAEERLRQRIRAVLRFALATVFFAISGLVSLGANATTAFAKKVNSGRRHHGLRVKVRSPRLRYHHSDSKMTGMASWYGREFNRRRTASGVRFDTHAMMAAHRTLPFGTKVLVTNLQNHKSCVVEITDRGPYAKGRIIDLSYAAAEQLGMTEEGVAPVGLAILGTPGPGVSDDLVSQSKVLEFGHAPASDAHQTFVVDEPAP